MRPPPPVIALLVAGGQRALTGPARPYRGRHLLAGVTAGAGLSLMAAAAWRLHGHRTTIDPVRPSRASALVTDGVYRHSRNPIYVADALMLIAHAAWLGRPVALVGLPVFVVAIQPQLRAEAAALAGSFGDDYDSYRSEVPTWVRSPVRLRPRRQPLR